LNMADFDFRGARAEGYSDAEILDHAAKAGKLGKFDLQGALKEGYTPSEIIDHMTQTTASGLAKAAGTGAEEAVIGIPGLLDAAGEYGARGLDAATRFVGDKLGVDVKPRADEDPWKVQKGLTNALDKAGLIHNSQNTGEDFANFGGSMLPNMAMGGGGILRRLLTGVVGPTIVGEGGGQLADRVMPEAAPIVRGVGAVLGGIPGSRVPLPAGIPERAALGRAADAGFDMQAPAGPFGFNNVALDAGVMPRIAQNVRSDMMNARITDPAAHADAHDALQRMATAVQAPGATTLVDLHNARKAFGEAAKQGGENAPVAAIAQRHIDNYLGNIPAGDVLSNTGGVTPAMYGANRIIAGPNPADVDRAQAGGRNLLRAIGNKAAELRSERLAGEYGQLDTAASKAQTKNSGLNFGNNMRQVVVNDLMRTEGHGLNANEIAAVRRLTDGTRAMNLARNVGNKLGGGGGIGWTHVSALGAAAAGGGAGAYEGGTPGAVIGSGLGGALLPFIGSFARGRHNAMVLREAQRLDAILRARSPLGGNQIIPAVPPSRLPRNLLLALTGANNGHRP
jgi:hypothetical protein